MCLVDCGTELMYQMFAPSIDAPLDPITKDLDPNKVLRLREECGLTDSEWEEAVRATERSMSAAVDEDNRGSARDLARWTQFAEHSFAGEGRPLSVMRTNMAGMGFQKLYDAGVELGNGTEEEREKARTFIETWRLFSDTLAAAQLRLKRPAEWEWTRYSYREDVGHDVVMRKPEYVVEDVRWVFGRLGYEW